MTERSVDEVVVELETVLQSRDDEWAEVAESSIRRALKFLDGLKYEDGVEVFATIDGGVRVDGSAHHGTWSVNFLSTGRFRFGCDMTMSGDTRIRKVLRALGER